MLVILGLRLRFDLWVAVTLTVVVAVGLWKGVIVGSGTDFADCSLSWGENFVKKVGCLIITGFGTMADDGSGMEVFCTFLSSPAFPSVFLSSDWSFALKKKLQFGLS